MTPEMEMKVAEWRHKAAMGTITVEEMIEAIKVVRGGRLAAAQASTTAKKATAKKVIVDADSLLDDWTS